MLSLIVAIADNNVIGKNNKLIWHIPEDLKRFKTITSGHKMLMGRKTFESLPDVLPNREHIIITRNKNFSINSDKVSIIHNLNNFINKYENSDEEIFVIGGAEIYKELLPFCKKIYLTRIYNSFDGDTFFPEINIKNYTVVYESEKFTDKKSNISYKFINLLKN
ncbi:MAG: dihydrofolate reductase [Clostridium butyricum]|nr:dihydrofolate reductase [Clostridium butyricum]